MQVTCPGCRSRFLLPAGVKNGTRLRCSVCRTEFCYEEEGAEEVCVPAPEPAPVPDERPLTFEKNIPAEGALPEFSSSRKRVGGSLWLLLLVLIAVGGCLAWQTVPEFRVRVQELMGMVTGQPAPAPMPAPANETAAQSRPADPGRLVLRDVRHYFVENEHLGPVLVVEGSVFNQGLDTRGAIEVEAALIDRDRRVIDSAVQKAGVRLSNFQLKVMSKAEMDTALNDEKEIAAVNARVVPGGQVPFMVVFFNPSQDVAEFAAKIGASEVVEASALAPAPAAPAPAAAAPAAPAPAAQPVNP
ncbi:MAG: DUF3426 domain-containing protein [Desulfovibrionaceae bacterium]|nr:DUF3426 domain-containing protein [Desulfovibrionaceae bacterium]